MRQLRIALAQHDPLEEFARAWLQGGGIAPAGQLQDLDGAQVGVLARDGCYQVELCCLRGGTVIPPHVHPNADTVEVGVLGAVRLSVRGFDPFWMVPDDRLDTFTRGRGIRINHNDMHGGQVLPGGAWFLSFQRWSGTPKSVLTDYEGEPLGPRHEALRA